MPGPCAPSTSVSIPRAASASTILSMGRMSAVGLVMWSSSASRVRGVTLARTISTTSSGEDTGNGMVATTTRAPVAPGHEVERVLAGAIGVIGGEELVARREGERAEHRVHPAGGVGDEGQVVGIGPHEGGQRAPRNLQTRIQLAAEEAHRLRFQLGAERGLMAQHLGRAGAVRAVVEEGDGGVERPERREVRRGGHGRARLRAA